MLYSLRDCQQVIAINTRIFSLFVERANTTSKHHDPTIGVSPWVQQIVTFRAKV